MEHLLKGPPNTCPSDLQLQLIGNLYAININVNTAQAANVARAVEGRRFHGVPPPKASFVTLHRKINSSLKTDHGCRLVSTTESAILQSFSVCCMHVQLFVKTRSSAQVGALCLASCGIVLPPQYKPYKHQSQSPWPSYCQHGCYESLLSCPGSLHGVPA